MDTETDIHPDPPQPDGDTPVSGSEQTGPKETSSQPPSPSQPAELTDWQATLGGGIAGCLAPLATSGLNAYNGESSLNLLTIPWGLVLVFGIIGAVVAYFLADRVRHHVFTCGIAAPFLVLGVVNSHKAGLTEKATAEAKAAEETAQQAAVEARTAKANEKTATQAALDAESSLEKAAAAAAAKPKLGAEAIKAVLESELPSL